MLRRAAGKYTSSRREGPALTGCTTLQEHSWQTPPLHYIPSWGVPGVYCFTQIVTTAQVITQDLGMPAPEVAGLWLSGAATAATPRLRPSRPTNVSAPSALCFAIRMPSCGGSQNAFQESKQ